ncbi:tail-specific protease [Bremerella cremea]|uniref:Tail-specific protease n=1 Tax=Blastopirellula marina TaxID=124 RepID=A0A2S8FUP5_9BACT|nr:MULTISPECIES: carboxy terminal-processing peptidase [Pirellulaceae]PQO35901.1 tail-specific protease [Blastopirellula marina]RCS48578.1 tail-specific protease [Bremerella cremea]
MANVRRKWTNLRHPAIFLFTVIATFAALVGASLLPQVAPAQAPIGPQANALPERHISRMVSRLLLRDHLSNNPLDDTISERAFDKFLKFWDPLKLYFTQQDVNEFAANRKLLDDQVRSGNTEFAHKVFDRFVKRTVERVQTVDDLLANHEFNFDEDEVFVTDGDKVDYPSNAAEATDRWRKRIKYDLLTQMADDKTLDEAKERIRKRYHSYARRISQTSEDELLEVYLTSITSSYDPHTTYMSPGTLENFNIQMRLNLEGIGAALQSEDGFCKVSKVIPGGAADKLGKKNPEEKLEPEDVIVSVGQGTDGEMVDVVDMKLNDVVDMIRGKANTIVRLGVKKKGKGETKIYNVTRAKVELSDSEARGEIIDQPLNDGSGKSLKIGWIDLPSFYMDMEGARAGKRDFKRSTIDVAKLLIDFQKSGVEAVVLDLRRNGGGSLTEAIDLTGLFIDHGPVVQVKDSDNNVNAYEDVNKAMLWDGPLVVLTSKMSASASEILAGAIQDYGRGIIVGDKQTHGKGTVQTLLDLGREELMGANPINPPSLGALKITLQKFYRPSGKSTQLNGVEADVSLPSLTTNMDIAEGDLDYAVPFDTVKTTEFPVSNANAAPIVAELNRLSTKRRESSEGFAKMDKMITTYLEQKDKKQVNLNKGKFMADYEALSEREKEIESLVSEDKEDPNEIVEHDYYFDEVIDITKDYVRLLEQQKVAANN